MFGSATGPTEAGERGRRSRAAAPGRPPARPDARARGRFGEISGRRPAALVGRGTRFHRRRLNPRPARRGNRLKEFSVNVRGRTWAGRPGKNPRPPEIGAPRPARTRRRVGIGEKRNVIFSRRGALTRLVFWRARGARSLVGLENRGRGEGYSLHCLSILGRAALDLGRARHLLSRVPRPGTAFPLRRRSAG